MSQEIYKRELGLGEVLKESFKHFIENLELFFILTLILYIPLNLFFRFFIIEKLTTDLFGSSTLFLPLLFIILSMYFLKISAKK